MSRKPRFWICFAFVVVWAYFMPQMDQCRQAITKIWRNQ